MLFVCCPKCSTCAKARKWLEEQGISFEERDIKTDNPTETELRDWHHARSARSSGFSIRAAFRYKALGLRDRLPEMSEAEQYALLATDSMLVKRPLLIEGLRASGFRERNGGKEAERISTVLRAEAPRQFLHDIRRVDIRRLMLYNKSCLSGRRHGTYRSGHNEAVFENRLSERARGFESTRFHAIYGTEVSLGFERRLLAACRRQLATAVDFHAENESHPFRHII